MVAVAINQAMTFSTRILLERAQYIVFSGIPVYFFYNVFNCQLEQTKKMF